MRLLPTIVVSVALAGSTLAATPTWAKTAFQYWAQGQGAYVSSKDHPSELYDYFFGVDGRPALPPPSYDAYGRPLAPYGVPGY